MSRHKSSLLLRPLLLLLLSAAALALPGQNSRRIQQLKKEHAALQQRITQSEQQLRSTRKSVTAQFNNLALLNAQITEQQQFVDSVQADITGLSADIHRLQQQLSALGRDLAACKQKYRRAVLYANRNRLQQNKWAFILMSKSFRQMYRRMRYAAEYSKYLRVQGEAIKQKEEQLRAKQRQLDAARAEKDQLLAAARQERSALEGQKQKRQAMVDELNKKQSQLQQTLQQNRRKSANLNARIEKLIQEEIAAAERRRKEAERRRQEELARRRREEAARQRAAAGRNRRKSGNARSGSSASRGSTATPRFEAETAADRTLSGNFAANRGRLPVPVTGTYAVTGRYGQQRVAGLGDVSLDNKGIDLTARRGAKARAVYGGEVSAVANIGGSYIVIVRHGSYYSVYSNLASVSVRRGQKVTTRQTIGTPAGDGSGNVVLHFQLRKKSGKTATPFNPLPWLAR